MADTRNESYTRRLCDKQEAWWKRVLHVQAPYRWNIRRQHLGRSIDVGCGVGRNLEALPIGSVGIDHNINSIQVCRARGYVALTTDEWEKSALKVPGSFDGLLIAHVIEHMAAEDSRTMLRQYLPYIRKGGRVFVVCPQERGYASDETHVQFFDGEAICALLASVDLVPKRSYSFPFPRFAGGAFTYNEFCVLAVKP